MFVVSNYRRGTTLFDQESTVFVFGTYNNRTADPDYREIHRDQINRVVPEGARNKGVAQDGRRYS